MTSTVPTMSKRRAFGSRDSCTAQSVAAAATTPIGTLIQNTADQLDVLDQEAAEQRPDGQAEARDAGPDADRGREPDGAGTRPR